MGRHEEGFSTFSENVDYTQYFKEVFLVTPDQWDNPNNYVNLYGAVQPIQPYTYDEAVAACADISGAWGKGQLATLDQLKMATNLFGANWCPGGWVQGDRNNLYYPMQKKGTCGNLTDVSGVKTISPYNGNKGYPICYAVKPPDPTRLIREFSVDNFPMIGPNVLSNIMSGNPADPRDMLYPVTFSVSQAYWALEQNGYNAKAARAALKDPAVRTTYDNGILAAIGGRQLTPEQKKTDTTCPDLQTTKADYERKIQTLESQFNDLSGAVYTAIAAKDENTNYIQAQVTNICRNPLISQTTADACSRLMSLDYDIFYRNLDPTGNTQMNLITDLEVINIALATQECTLQQSFGALKTTMDALCPNVQTSWNILKDNTMGGSIITCSYPVDRTKIPSTAFKVGSDIQMNMVDLFKYNLEQISPYFNTDKYASLMANILNQLSITMRTPPPEQYIDAQNTFSIANSYAVRIYNLLVG
jgi:hypothetical protein